MYRLVGFDTPESGSLARCERERKLADAATTRLRQLIANAQPSLERVPCSCPPGTEGTNQCNYGRLCAHLRADGRDVGTILISEDWRAHMCAAKPAAQGDRVGAVSSALSMSAFGVKWHRFLRPKLVAFLSA